MIQLVLLRHGESISNRDGYFTGWNDVALSPRGEEEAERAGRLLKKAGCEFDMCFTSELRRATDTLHIVLSAMGLNGLTTQQSWRLNERHYGALEGIQRFSAIRKFGIWPILDSQLRFTAPPPLARPQRCALPWKSASLFSYRQERIAACGEHATNPFKNAALLAGNNRTRDPAWKTAPHRVSPACLACIDNAVGWIIRCQANDVVHCYGATIDIST